MVCYSYTAVCIAPHGKKSAISQSITKLSEKMWFQFGVGFLQNQPSCTVDTIQLSSSSSSLNDRRLEFGFFTSSSVLLLSVLCVCGEAVLSALCLLSAVVLAFLVIDEADRTALLPSLDRFAGFRNRIRPNDSAPGNSYQQHADN